MTKRHYRWTLSLLLVAMLVVGITLLRPQLIQAQSQFPVVDSIANKVVQKYTSSTCEQLWQKKGQPPSEREQRAIQFMRQNPNMRTYFINQVAGPIANKMFDCGMIP